MRRTRLGLVPALVLSLLLGACSGTEPDPAPAGGTGERAAFEPGPYGDGDLEADVEALAGWGIETYADDRSAEPMVPVDGPAAPLRLLRDQVETMGREAAAGAGTQGADLDAVLGELGPEVRLSSLLAAWLQSGSPMASALRERLTTVDLENPDQAVFPTVVLTGFIRDLAPQQLPSASPAAFHDPASRAGTRTCSASASWIEGMLGNLFGALEIPVVDVENWPAVLQPLGWLVNAFITVYDAIRRGAQAVVINGIKYLVAPIRNVLAQVSLFVAVLQTALTSITPLTSSWDGPGAPEFGVLGDAELRYETTVKVRSTNPLVWPPLLRDCAQAAGIDLPNPSLDGSQVFWSWRTAEGGVIRQLDSDPLLRADAEGGGEATFRFATGQEPREWKERGDANLVQAIVTAKVQRKNKQIRDAVSFAVRRAVDQLLGFLPDFLRQRAVGVVHQAVDPLLDELVVRSEYTTAKSFLVTRHLEPEDTPSPTPTMPTPSPPPPRPQPVWVHVDRPGIPGSVEPGRILQFLACDGIAGTWRGLLRTGGLYDDDGFAVPWADLPARPFRIGNGGIGSTTSRASGTTQVLGQSVPVTFDLVISVDGRSMRVDGVPVQPPVSFQKIPIRNAPKAVCP